MIRRRPRGTAVIAITAVLRAQKGSEVALRQALLDVVAYVRADEPGTVSYFVSEDLNDPCVFTTYERYVDEAAAERHNASEAVARFFEIAKPILDGSATVVTGREIAGKS
jgi:quinol monooxygenase YgiN